MERPYAGRGLAFGIYRVEIEVHPIDHILEIIVFTVLLAILSRLGRADFVTGQGDIDDWAVPLRQRLPILLPGTGKEEQR